MRMHVNAKKIALAGVLTAFVVILLVIASVVESNSLFFISAASFCVGIVIREWGKRMGASFLIASTLISLLVAPNKLYCITYIAMGIYLLLSELLWVKLAENEKARQRGRLLWIGRYVIFNCIFIPGVVFFQELLFVKTVSGLLFVLVIIVGQIALFLYEMAYNYFQTVLWGRLRSKLL